MHDGITKDVRIFVTNSAVTKCISFMNRLFKCSDFQMFLLADNSDFLFLLLYELFFIYSLCIIWCDSHAYVRSVVLCVYMLLMATFIDMFTYLPFIKLRLNKGCLFKNTHCSRSILHILQLELRASINIKPLFVCVLEWCYC